MQFRAFFAGAKSFMVHRNIGLLAGIRCGHPGFQRRDVMVAVTFGTARVAVGSAPHESVLARLIAMIESRTPRRGVEMHSQSRPPAEELPFGGW
jgi:hypothetical protein